ncbi:hypothetical protein NC651_016016 [Populus alba x Populus x berolinensis]|nr:hypothetical protein NC651_016016 [Populus alba x Populus x berolinensis]
MPCTTTTPMTIPRRQTTADQMRPQGPTRFFLLFEQCSGCGSDLSNHATNTVPNRNNNKYKNYYNVRTFPRFPIPNSHSNCSLHSLLSLCSRSLLSFPSRCFRFPSHSHSLRSRFSSMTMAITNHPSPPQSPSTKTVMKDDKKEVGFFVRVMIKGRVQGVFYRNWTVENAIRLGLKGWVRNRRDGSVEALFSGDSDNVQEMEQRCRRGPPDAMVTGFQILCLGEGPAKTNEHEAQLAIRSLSSQES